eukprot:CAMPEP_0172689464 /NCGR_PEP_ID=MMETSP1074-20121228/23167_1 /TAXON_ID=2916 /ORGANISM="Ceratium fusus, Strain PA161109" /LENGTH=41 /DNA_ID= /DNA_START= /DNA_END= /DNA_ORIENTATION=
MTMGYGPSRAILRRQIHCNLFSKPVLLLVLMLIVAAAAAAA